MFLLDSAIDIPTMIPKQTSFMPMPACGPRPERVVVKRTQRPSRPGPHQGMGSMGSIRHTEKKREYVVIDGENLFYGVKSRQIDTYNLQAFLKGKYVVNVMKRNTVPQNLHRAFEFAEHLTVVQVNTNTRLSKFNKFRTEAVSSLDMSLDDRIDGAHAVKCTDDAYALTVVDRLCSAGNNVTFLSNDQGRELPKFFSNGCPAEINIVYTDQDWKHVRDWAIPKSHIFDPSRDTNKEKIESALKRRRPFSDPEMPVHVPISTQALSAEPLPTPLPAPLALPTLSIKTEPITPSEIPLTVPSMASSEISSTHVPVPALVPASSGSGSGTRKRKIEDVKESLEMEIAAKRESGKIKVARVMESVTMSVKEIKLKIVAMGKEMKLNQMKDVMPVISKMDDMAYHSFASLKSSNEIFDEFKKHSDALLHTNRENVKAMLKNLDPQYSSSQSKYIAFLDNLDLHQTSRLASMPIKEFEREIRSVAPMIEIPIPT